MVSFASIPDLPARIAARVMAPVQARLTPLPRLAVLIDEHLEAGRVTVAGALAEAGIRRSGRAERFLVRRARFHLARSEWDQARIIAEPLSGDSAKETAARALLAQKRPQDALAKLAGVASLSALDLQLVVGLRLRDDEAVSAALNRLLPETGPRRIGVITETISSPYFRYFFRSDKADRLEAFVSSLNPGALAALIGALHVAGRSHRYMNDWLIAPAEAGNAHAAALYALVRAALSQRPTNTGDLIGTGWIEPVYAYFGDDSFVEIVRAAGALPHLRRRLGQSAGGLPEAVRRLLLLESRLIETDAHGAAELGADVSALIQSRALSLVNVSGLARGFIHRFGIAASPEVISALVRRLNRSKKDRTRRRQRRVARLLSWMTETEDLIAPFLDFIGDDSAALIESGRQLSSAHGLRLLDHAIARYPRQLDLHVERVRQLVRSDDQDRLERDLRSAKHAFATNPEALALLSLESEDWRHADEQFRSIQSSLSPDVKLKWRQSLMKRGRIDQALAIPLQASLSSVEVELLKTARQQVSELEMGTLQGPADLVPSLRRLATPPDSKARGVLLVSSTLRPGGGERQVSATAIGLKRTQPDLDLALLTRTLDPSIQADFFAETVRAQGVDVGTLITPRDAAVPPLLALLPGELAEFAIPLYFALKQHPKEIVHLWQDRTALGGAFAALLAGTPRIIMSLRSTRPDARRRHRPYQRSLFQALLREFPERIVLVNNSYYGARDYEDWLNLEEGRIKVIHNGFDLDAICGRAGEALSKRLPDSHIGDSASKRSQPLLGWVGRFTFEKRPQLWTQTAINLVNADPEYRALAAGDGPLLERCRAMVETHSGLSAAIQFLGVQRPIEPLMSQFDLLLLTSEREGLPNVLIEAQALGVPVVTLAAGGASEAVDHGRTGLVLPLDSSAEDIAASIAALLSDPAKRSMFANNAPEWTRAMFSQEKMIERTLELYFGPIQPD